MTAPAAIPLDVARERAAQLEATSREPVVRGRTAISGAAFVLDGVGDVPAICGDDHRVAWAEGESIIVAAPQGVGKTTLAPQAALARRGLRPTWLDMPVRVDPRPVFYLAMDRPAQAARSFRRMVTEDDREALAAGLRVWPGPLPIDITVDPNALAGWVLEHGENPGTLIVDSAKDLAPGLASDEVGSRVNLALQAVLASGVEVVLLHHQRKATSDNRRPTTLADVYGSTWLTAGAGSVLLLWGEPGDAVVELHHLKQPLADIGPLTLVHDHSTGTTRVDQAPSISDLLAANPAGLTAGDAARELYGAADPTRNQVEKARRALDREQERGYARSEKGTTATAPRRYFACAPGGSE